MHRSSHSLAIIATCAAAMAWWPPIAQGDETAADAQRRLDALAREAPKDRSVDALVRKTAASPSISATDPVPVPQASAARGYELVLPDHAELSRVLADFLKRNDWKMAWTVGSDYRIDYGFTVRAESIDAVLGTVAKKWPLIFTLHTANKVVHVAPATVQSFGAEFGNQKPE